MSAKASRRLKVCKFFVFWAVSPAQEVWKVFSDIGRDRSAVFWLKLKTKYCDSFTREAKTELQSREGHKETNTNVNWPMKLR